MNKNNNTEKTPKEHLHDIIYTVDTFLDLVANYLTVESKVHSAREYELKEYCESLNHVYTEGASVEEIRAGVIADMKCGVWDAIMQFREQLDKIEN